VCIFSAIALLSVTIAEGNKVAGPPLKRQADRARSRSGIAQVAADIATDGRRIIRQREWRPDGLEFVS